MDGITNQEEAKSRIHRFRWWTLSIVSVTSNLSGTSHAGPANRVTTE